MSFKLINVLWQRKSGSLSIRCQAHNAPGILMKGEDITLFCAAGGHCILGEWEDVNAYKEDLRNLKERVRKSPLLDPPTKKAK
jgi:hypothetical protein